MAKGNRKRVLQYKNEVGLYFVLAEKVFDQIAEDSNISRRRVNDFAILFYIQKYVLSTNHVVITRLARTANQMGFDYSVNMLNQAFRYFLEIGIVEYWGNRYHFYKKSFDFIKRFDYWLHFYMSNFHSVVEEGRPALLQRRRMYNKKKAKEKNKNQNT